LAITSSHRSPLVPDLPTMDEAGVAGYEMMGWNGVFVATGTQQRIIDKLHDALVGIIATPELKAQLAQLGAEPVGNSSVEFAAFIRSEHERWGRIIRERGIKPE
jgi:tripartite-type tricarboxylate transporter receptor subunit TctC